ncbi:uncharacterized protein [Euwallacea fornicatus]|uniref:uncharacterized protein isoform X1 n=2 Tax=Euwallacea fornicatus TaxID=995702 RepID=UPI00338FC51A
MPVDYYSPDNFFKKMTDLESPKKNNDCYFYYYSTCTKGDSCSFRHEPSALGCETVCSFWKEGKCLNVHCSFRHMELRKNRKAIPCYWELQPGGCLKPHCPFMHQNQSNDLDNKLLGKTETALPENCIPADGSLKNTSAVDSLVVNFEEESDSESAISTSPTKYRVPRVKTLEEIKLEKIAAESAAYYFYPGSHQSLENFAESDLRRKILHRVRQPKLEQSRKTIARKLTKEEIGEILGEGSPKRDTATSTNDYVAYYGKRRKLTNEENVQDVKIKTLDEIRAERNYSKEQCHLNTNPKENCGEPEVSSTSNDKQQPSELLESELLPQPAVESLRLLRQLNMSKIRAQLPLEVTTDAELNIFDNIKSDAVLNNELRDTECADINALEEQSLLLLDDVDEDMSIKIKPEDDLLNEIDGVLMDE